MQPRIVFPARSTRPAGPRLVASVEPARQKRQLDGRLTLSVRHVFDCGHVHRFEYTLAPGTRVRCFSCEAP